VERILGRALQGHGDVPFVATKIFPLLPLAPVVEQRGVASALRLGLRHLDLYQVHQPNPLVRDRTTMRGMRALQDVGLVGAVGVSNYSLERWRRAEAALGRPVLSNQARYSLVDRRPERELIPYAEDVGRVVIAYSPLAQGFLSGRYNASTPASGPDAPAEQAVPSGHTRAWGGALRCAASGRGRTRRHAGTGRTRLDDPPPERRRDSGRILGGAGRIERGGGRSGSAR